jgi:hypothetical protein
MVDQDGIGRRREDWGWAVVGSLLQEGAANIRTGYCRLG